MSKNFNMFSPDAYSGGGMLPEGNYAIWFEAVNHEIKNAQGVSQGAPRLGVMLTCVDLADGKTVREQFLSAGTSADKSFTPDPNGGKKFIAIPGASAQTLNNMTNWYAFYDSLLNCGGIPEGMEDFTTIDGIWVHIQNVPESEERKAFKSQAGATSEVPAGGQTSNKPRMNPVVTEVLPGGEPWNGGGGMPAGPAAQAPKPAGKPGPKTPATPKPAAPVAPTPKPGPKATPKPAVAAQEEVVNTDIDVTTLAADSISTVLMEGNNAIGMPWIKLRIAAHGLAKKKHGDEAATAMVDAILNDETQRLAVLGTLGFQISGSNVVPIG